MDLTSLFADVWGAAFTLGAFVVALLIIVAVHEYGHYIVGRWSGIHAEVFSLGFGPKLFSRVDKRGTRWQIAALPFGGYVRFMGDTNAASGGGADLLSDMTPEQRRASMHGAPLWARAATVAAGPLFNFALAIVVLAGLITAKGIATDSPTVGQLRPFPAEVSNALQQGDLVLAVNGQATPDYSTLYTVAEGLGEVASVTYDIDRAGEKLSVQGPHPLPPMVSAVQPRSAAIAAGLVQDDVITSVDGVAIHSFQRLRDLVGASDGKPLVLTVWRGGETKTLTLTPARQDIPLADGSFETRFLIGVSGGLVFDPAVRRPGVVETLELAGWQSWRAVEMQFSGLWHIVAGKISTCNIGGPISIAQTSGAAAAQGWDFFVQMIAMLSIAVGVMNLFPIPVLDGGHLMFHAWEAVTGHPPTARAMSVMMTIGLMFILSLMAFALWNDILC